MGRYRDVYVGVGISFKLKKQGVEKEMYTCSCNKYDYQKYKFCPDCGEALLKTIEKVEDWVHPIDLFGEDVYEKYSLHINEETDIWTLFIQLKWVEDNEAFHFNCVKGYEASFEESHKEVLPLIFENSEWTSDISLVVINSYQ